MELKELRIGDKCVWFRCNGTSGLSYDRIQCLVIGKGKKRVQIEHEHFKGIRTRLFVNPCMVERYTKPLRVG